MNNAKELLSSGLKVTQLGIDWISATVKNRRPGMQWVVSPLRDIKDWSHRKGSMGYDRGASHCTGVIQLSSSTRSDMGTHIIYNSQSIKRIEEHYEMNSIDVLKFHLLNDDKVARIDIALDLINHGVDIREFERAFVTGKCRTRAKSGTTMKSLTESGHTFYIGSRKRRKKLLRIYDKASEQGIKGDWVRFELQVMGSPATVLSYKMIHNEDTKSVLLGAIEGYCSFPTVPIWSEVMSDNEAVSIGSISTEKGDTRIWLENQVLPSMIKEARLDVSFWKSFKLRVDEALKEENEPF